MTFSLRVSRSDRPEEAVSLERILIGRSSLMGGDCSRRRELPITRKMRTIWIRRPSLSAKDFPKRKRKTASEKNKPELRRCQNDFSGSSTKVHHLQLCRGGFAREIKQETSSHSAFSSLTFTPAAPSLECGSYLRSRRDQWYCIVFTFQPHGIENKISL